MFFVVILQDDTAVTQGPSPTNKESASSLPCDKTDFNNMATFFTNDTKIYNEKYSVTYVTMYKCINI